jgi:hypothetical protein
VAKRLLDRQVELLEYLTSSAAIFAGGGAGSSAPSGFDPELLRLEARFSHDKRLEKVRAVFDRTFVILGASLGELTREFLPKRVRRRARCVDTTRANFMSF